MPGYDCSHGDAGHSLQAQKRRARLGHRMAMPPSGKAPRLALQLGLVLAHAAAVGLAVAILRAALARWSVPRGEWRIRTAILACWIAPLVIWRFIAERQVNEQLPLLASVIVITILALSGTRLIARFRHGSQAFRLTLLTLALIAPAFAFYPTLFQLAWRAKSQLVESLYAPQALNQRTQVQRLLNESLDQIDALPDLNGRVSSPLGATEEQAETAFELWWATSLADYPVTTSSVEVYNADRKLVSRYAFNLPDEELAAPSESEESSCQWVIVSETNPFFADNRVILHAGRRLCGASGEMLGSIVVRALEEYKGERLQPYTAYSTSCPATPLRIGSSGRTKSTYGLRDAVNGRFS